MIHGLTEAALSIDDCKHPKVMFLQRSEPQIYEMGFCVFITFSNAECVVATGHKVVEGHKQVGVILAGPSQQVLFGVPAGRFRQVWFLKSF